MDMCGVSEVVSPKFTDGTLRAFVPQHPLLPRIPSAKQEQVKQGIVLECIFSFQ